GREMDPRPSDRLRRQLVEPEGVPADRPPVVVSSDRSDVPLAEDLAHLLRPWIVPDVVPGQPDAVRADPIDVGEHGLQRGEIRVDVGENGEAHRAAERVRPISGSQYGARMRRQSRHRDRPTNSSGPRFRRSVLLQARRNSSIGTIGSRTASSWRRGSRLPSPSRTGDNSPSRRGGRWPDKKVGGEILDQAEANLDSLTLQLPLCKGNSYPVACKSGVASASRR